MRIDNLKFIVLLKKRDMTQKQLAEISGISKATINSIASGKSCSQESAEKIAAALEVDLNEILTDQEVQRGRA